MCNQWIPKRSVALPILSSLFVELFNTYNVATDRLDPAPSGTWGKEASAVRMDTVYVTEE